MYRSLFSRAFFLLFSFTVGLLFTGCSGDSVAPVTPKVAAKHKTFYDPPLRMIGEGKKSASLSKVVGAEAEGGGLCSWLINTVEEGLTEGITSFIGDNTTGRVLNGISKHTGDSGAAAQFAQISSQLTTIGGQITTLQAQVNSLLNTLNLGNAVVVNQVNATALTSYVSSIQAQFGGTSDSYMYIVSQAQKADLTNAATVTNLKKLVTAYTSTSNATTTSMGTNLLGIHDLICSDGLLNGYANQIILQNTTSDAATAVTTAENGYLLLQQYFAKLITYQLQAIIIIAELDNYKDTTGAATKADLAIFQGYIKDEVAEFQKQVNYLMINLIDHRNSTTYNTDSSYMRTTGIAPDDTYNMVFATSRAFTAQLLNNFQPDFGFHGALVIPLNNTPPTAAGYSGTPQPVTITLTGPSTISMTAKLTQSTGRFPYTKWTTSGQASPDNNWVFYEFTAPNDVPAGIYTIALVDNGSSNAPWYHTTTDLGQVSVLYYNPTNFSAGGTLTKTTTNTFKFASVSGRWNWGYNMMSLAPWTVPSTARLSADYGVVPNPFSTTFCSNDTPSVGKAALSAVAQTFWVCSDTKSHIANYTNSFFYPQVNDQTNKFGMLIPSFTSYGMDEVWYTMNFPFTIAALMPDGTTPAVSIYYNITGTVISSNFMVDYAYSLNDTTKSTSAVIPLNNSTKSYSDSTFGNINYPVNQQGILNTSATVPITGSDNYTMSVSAELNSNYIFGGGNRSGNIVLNSDMQIVYSNMYPLPSNLY